jgi:predicted nucleic acid-binding protein
VAGELLLDTSGLVSLLDRSQAHHAACATFYRRWTRPVVTTEAVITESTHGPSFATAAGVSRPSVLTADFRAASSTWSPRDLDPARDP